jgi:hypothetical protein
MVRCGNGEVWGFPPMSLPATNAKRLRTGARATKQSTFDLAILSHGLLRWRPQCTDGADASLRKIR